MNLLSVDNISKSFGEKLLFNNISFGINSGDKIALIAKNGGGKTTLINILKGKETVDSGEIAFQKDCIISFLDQNPVLDLKKSVIDTLLYSDNKLSVTIKEYEHWLAESTHNPTQHVLNMLDKYTNQMNELNAWDYETKIKQILFKLNITNLEQPIGQLSGGQQKRVALADVLIHEPELLIMDEPTNHLDMEMIEWIEEYINSRNMSLLVVTHDRYFLDQVCNQILEIDNLQLYKYEGNFSYYLEKKAQRLLAEAAETEKYKNIYRRELEWMRRMPKARTTKSKARIDDFYDIEAKAKKQRNEQQVQLSVKMNRLGNKILELKKINKKFPTIKIVEDFSYIFKKGEKIGILGKNGIGKSTLLNIILGKEAYDSGEINTGETVIFGYYSQQGIQLPEDKRVIEVVKDIADNIPLANGACLSASQLLIRFNFPAEQQFNFVSKLSGGEKRRLYLLTVLVRNPNFLILDEPTNDLDIQTLQTLEEFLTEFMGCILIVSHDRFFIDKLSDHLFVFEGDGIIKDFPGNYSDYKVYSDEKKELEELKIKELKKENTTQKSDNVVIQKKKLSFNEKYEFEKLEKEISLLEIEKKIIEETMNSGETDHSKLQKVANRFNEITNLLDKKTLRWLELSEKES